MISEGLTTTRSSSSRVDIVRPTVSFMDDHHGTAGAAAALLRSQSPAAGSNNVNSALCPFRAHAQRVATRRRERTAGLEHSAAARTLAVRRRPNRGVRTRDCWQLRRQRRRQGRRRQRPHSLSTFDLMVCRFPSDYCILVLFATTRHNFLTRAL